MPKCYVLYECHYCNKLYIPKDVIEEDLSNKCCGIGVDVLMYCSECDKYIDDCKCEEKES